MKIPVDRFVDAFRLGVDAKRDSDVPVRVAVRVDASATPFLVDSIRRALVPETTNGLVRVGRLRDRDPIKADTDIVLVLSCGSGDLEDRVRELLVYGVPVAVVAESSVEASFISSEAPLLGLIAATDESHLLRQLADWILRRTEKRAAFAANFAFMRSAVSTEIVGRTVVANAVTGALEFIPGADFPVMTANQVGMMIKLAAAHGKPMGADRLYDAAGVIGCGLAFRAGSRTLSRRFPKAAFVPKSLVAACGTYMIGRALEAVYSSGFDYAPLNDAFARVALAVRGAARPASSKDIVTEQ